MSKLAVGAVSVLLITFAAYAQTTPHKAATSPDASSTPSDAEIGELIGKASEYIDTYKQTFRNTKTSLDKAPNPGFYEKGWALSEQASSVITAIQKNGSTAVALVSLLSILDDMSLNAAKASAATMLLAVGQNKSNSDNRAMQDFQDIAQAGKNCYDMSELLFHATIRYISREEAILRTLLDRQKQP